MPDGDLILLSDYAGAGGPSMGGAGMAVLDSFLALRQEGARASLLTGLDLPDGAAATTEVVSLHGRDLRAGSSLAALKTIYNPASRDPVATALAGRDPGRTVIILHQWTRYLTPSAIALLRRFPLMVYMHDYFWACPNGAYFNFRSGEPCRLTPASPACIASNCDRAGYAHKAIRLARHAALALATRGSAHRPLFLHISEQAQEVGCRLIPDGRHAIVYNPALRQADAAPTPREERQLRFDVGYFGRLEPEKGLPQLLAGLRTLGMRGLFVGEGSMEQAIDETPGMTRLGWQSKEEVATLMRQCRAVSLPSRWPETWGLITAEAMMLGVPVLVSDRAGSGELVRRFGGGLLFDPDRAVEIEGALNRLRAGLDPVDAAGREGLRRLLSPRHHAATIAALARDHWGIDPMPSATGAVPQPSATAAIS